MDGLLPEFMLYLVLNDSVYDSIIAFAPLKPGNCYFYLEIRVVI